MATNDVIKVCLWLIWQQGLSIVTIATDIIKVSLWDNLGAAKMRQSRCRYNVTDKFFNWPRAIDTSMLKPGFFKGLSFRFIVEKGEEAIGCYQMGISATKNFFGTFFSNFSFNFQLLKKEGPFFWKNQHYEDYKFSAAVYKQNSFFSQS